MRIEKILSLAVLRIPFVMTFTIRPVSSRTTTTAREMQAQDGTNRQLNAGATFSGSTVPQLSREEMRQRRLAVLGLAEPSTGTSSSATAPTNTPPPPSNRSRTHQTVIDLCDSDSDDESIDLVARFLEHQSQNAGSSTNSTVPSSASPSTNNTSSRKRPAKALASAHTTPLTTFQIATYNLWFQSVHTTERMEAISQILAQCHQPDNPLVMVGFQEVIPPLASVLFPSLERQGYSILRQPLELVPYGCAMAIRTDVASIIESGFRPFRNSNMGRGILYARVRLSSTTTTTEQNILFTTTHLESWAGEEHPGSTQRQSQILEMEDFCVQMVSKHATVQCAVITGDLNWDDERARSAGPDPVMLQHLKKPWTDVWKHLYGNNKKAIGYTYDAKLNPMLGGSLRRRFDRILLYPDDDSCQVQSTDFLGKEALPGLSWSKTNSYNNTVRSVPVAPSDHFGLLAQLKLENIL